MGRLSDEWKYDELKPRPAKDREKAAKKIASLPYEEAVKEMEKLHSEFNINDHNDISRRVMEKTKGNPDNYGKKPGYEVVNDKNIDAIKDNFTPPGAKIGVDNEFVEYSEKPKALTKDHIEKYGEEMLKTLGASDEQIAEAKDEIDTNDNGKIEEDEMADFQKSLDDYASKNKKGRDDIPVTTRR